LWHKLLGYSPKNQISNIIAHDIMYQIKAHLTATHSS
jgi:hypothetical protein